MKYKVEVFNGGKRVGVWSDVAIKAYHKENGITFTYDMGKGTVTIQGSGSTIVVQTQ